MTVEVTHNSYVDSICFSKQAVISGNLHLQSFVWQKDVFHLNVYSSLTRRQKTYMVSTFKYYNTLVPKVSDASSILSIKEAKYSLPSILMFNNFSHML